jgi:diamine N-acetyltransferase
VLSWDAVPNPPDVIGPRFLWKFLVDRDHQGNGYGAEVVRQVVSIVRAEGATERNASRRSRIPG